MRHTEMVRMRTERARICLPGLARELSRFHGHFGRKFGSPTEFVQLEVPFAVHLVRAAADAGGCVVVDEAAEARWHGFFVCRSRAGQACEHHD